MESYLERVLLGAAINLGFLLPLFGLAFLSSRRNQAALKPVLLFALFVLMDIAFVWLFKLVRFVPNWGNWNWQGKLLEAAWPVLLALALPAAFPARRLGLTLPEGRRSWRTLAITCALYIIVAIAVFLSLGARFGIHGTPATFAYEATMPGLGEELMYRGLLLMLLNEAFGRPWKFAGIQFGWGFIIVTAMFGFLHGVDVEPGQAQLAHVYWSGMIFPALIGVVLAWLRERTGSVWPGVIFHNVVNVLNHLIA